MNKSEVKEKKIREPLFRIVKRDAIVWWKAWLIRVAAVIVALMVVAVITLLMTGQNPFEMYKAMVDGAVGNSLRTWNLLQDTALLLIAALAITPAFKMRFWNIGAQGQILAGALATTACLHFLTEETALTAKIPTPLLYVVMVVAAIVAGAVWAVIPGIFKAYLNTNETLFTLMMNYIALNLVAFFCFRWSKNSGNDVIGLINRKTKIGWLPEIGGNKFLFIIIVVFILTVASFIYLRYSKHGYEISVVGESENTARYIGINVKKVIVRTVLLSGALCGIAGFLLVSGVHHTLTTDVEGGRGFTAIIVSWMAHFNPFYMILTSLLIVFLEKGAIQVASSKNLQLDDNFSDIVVGIIILFIIGCEFFINYKIKFKSKNNGEEALK